MIILGDFFLLALGVLDRDLALQALRTAAASALEVFIGIEVEGQQAANLIAHESLVALEQFVGGRQRCPQRLQMHPRGGISQGIIADGLGVTQRVSPGFPARLTLELEKAGGFEHGAEEQAKPDGRGGDVGVATGVGDAPGQPVEVKDFANVGAELTQSHTGEGSPDKGSSRRSSSRLIQESWSRVSSNWR